MRNVLAITLAVGLISSTAMGTELNMSVKATANDTNAVTVGPGDPVPFYVEGVLSDDLNEGLALVGFTLHFVGGPLAVDTIDVPTGGPTCENPMPNFVKDLGITNPDGFIGTLIGDDLVQIGGAQNTIKNDATNADFPIGLVIPGVAQPAVCGPAVIATGALTAPTAEGDYELQLSELFANVIAYQEDGSGTYWAVVEAGPGSVANLTVTVRVGGADLVSTTPACDTSLTRPWDNVVRLTFSGAVTLPTAANLQIQALDAGGAFTGPNLADQFLFSLEAGDTVLRIKENGTVLSGGVGQETWYGIVNTGAWAGVSNFEVDYPAVYGNANNDGFTDFGDLSFINANLVDPAADDDLSDINADGFVDFGDLSAANSFNNAVVPTKPSGHTCSP